jgi:hypothetical protein
VITGASTAPSGVLLYWRTTRSDASDVLVGQLEEIQFSPRDVEF